MELFSTATPLWLELWAVFLLGSVVGWFIECGYRSYHARRFVDPGLMHGPVVPLYGFGLIIILYGYSLTDSYGFVGASLLMTLAVTLLEYAAGSLVERFVGVKLWDYSDRPLNLQGRICFQFSLYWFLLIGIVLLGLDAVQVYLSDLRIDLSNGFWRVAGVVTIGVFCVDTAVSTISLVRLRAVLERFRHELQEHPPVAAVQRRLRHFLRWTRRFPDLGQQLLNRRPAGIIGIIPDEYRPSRRFEKQRRDLQRYVDEVMPADAGDEQQRLVRALVAPAAVMPVRAERVLYAVLHPDDPERGLESLRVTERLLVNLVRTRISLQA